MILWLVMSVKLNIGKKIAELEIITLNRENVYRVFKLAELMSKEKLHCLQGCFRKQICREDVKTCERKTRGPIENLLEIFISFI